MSIWPIKTIGDLAEVVTKGTTPTSVGHKFTESGINFVKVESIRRDGSFIPEKFGFIDNSCHSDLKRSQLAAGDILFSIAGALGRTAFVSDDILPANTNQALAIIRLRPSESVFPPYVMKALSSGVVLEQIEKQRGGVAQQNLSLAQIKGFSIPLPSHPEQKRIVAILDETFAGIDQAIANTEKNLVSARELFENSLNNIFNEKGKGWETRRFEECFRLRSGDGLTSKEMIDGPYPVFGGNGIAGQHNEFNLSGNNVIIGRVGALCGNARFVKKQIWLTDNAFKIVNFKYNFDESFLTYLLNYKNLRSLARQAAQPVISNSSLKDLILSFPLSIDEQCRISRKIELIEKDAQTFQNVCKRKIAALNELKQSLLQKAFSGELATDAKLAEAAE